MTNFSAVPAYNPNMKWRLVTRLLGLPLMTVLTGEQKLMIALMPEADLIDLHFTLGLAIRNAFGLHEPGNKLLVDCGTAHPDDASGAIILELWKKLQC